MEDGQQNDTLASVKRIWLELLNLNSIQPGQNFFEVGGDSLSMLEMLFRVNQELGVEIDPGLLFQEPTLDGFCSLVKQARLAR